MKTILCAAVLAVSLTGLATTPLAAEPTPAAYQGAPAAKNPNKFNRLMKSSIETNAPPMTDGIHDPSNPGTEALQPPREAFGDLPRGNSGNKVDWVKALRGKQIEPRSDRENPNVNKQVMDLDIIREVKGSMPDVVYPHKQHTEWLDCGQCHPKLFTPKKGANPISMASILMGQYCGVCHGKVAFPVSECSKCHSKSKPAGMMRTSDGKLEPISAALSSLTATVQPPQATPVAATVPAVASAKPGEPMTKDQAMDKGKQVYADTCAGCHGENGEGVEGTFPPLKGSKVAKGPVDMHIRIVLKGVADTAMQAWGESMSDEDIAAAITFERNAWGNGTGDLVQPAAIKAAR